MAIIKILVLAAGMALSFGAQAQTQWALSADGHAAHFTTGEGWALNGTSRVEAGVSLSREFVLWAQVGEREVVVRGDSIQCDATKCLVQAPRLHRSGEVIYAITAEIDLRDGRVILEWVGLRSIQEET